MDANEMKICGWLVGMKVLTADEVKTLPIGKKVYLIGPDKYGEKTVAEGVIEQIGNVRSKRVCFGSMDGFERKMIRDYPGKVWAVKEGAIGV